jgi:hypothetical protein
MVEDHGASDDAAGVAAEVFEEGEFLLGELELDAGATSLAADEIDFKIGDAQARGLRLVRSAAAEQGAEASLEFCHGEGFGHVVVAATLESKDALVHRTARGQDQDRRGDALGTETLDQVEAVSVREIEIDNQSVVDAFEGQAFGLTALGARVNAEAGFGKGPGKEIANGVVIFNDKQPHEYS